MNQGVLYKTKCYLAGNLEFEEENVTKEWRNYFKEQVKPMGITCFSPLDKVFKDFGQPETYGFQKHLKEALGRGEFDYVHEQAKIFRDRDLRMVDLASFVVCVLNVQRPSFGTTDEVLTALEQKKPVMLCISGGYKNIPLWLSAYFRKTWVYSDVDEMINMIKRIDSGKEKLNIKYWRIPTQEYL